VKVERRQRFWRLQLQPKASRLRAEREAALARAASAGIALSTAADHGGEAV
jgi:hypothetical protein